MSEQNYVAVSFVVATYNTEKVYLRDAKGKSDD